MGLGVNKCHSSHNRDKIALVTRHAVTQILRGQRPQPSTSCIVGYEQYPYYNRPDRDIRVFLIEGALFPHCTRLRSRPESRLNRLTKGLTRLLHGLHLASREAKDNIVQLLLDHDADADGPGPGWLGATVFCNKDTRLRHRPGGR